MRTASSISPSQTVMPTGPRCSSAVATAHSRARLEFGQGDFLSRSPPPTSPAPRRQISPSPTRAPTMSRCSARSAGRAARPGRRPPARKVRADDAERAGDLLDRHRHDDRDPALRLGRRRRAERQPHSDTERDDDDPLVELGEPGRSGIAELPLVVQRADALRRAADRRAWPLLRVLRRRRGVGEATRRDVARRDPDECLRPLGRSGCGPGREPAYQPLAGSDGSLRFRLSSPITLIDSHCTFEGQLLCEPPGGWTPYVLNSAPHDYSIDPSVVNPVRTRTCGPASPSSSRSCSAATSGRRSRGGPPNA